MNTRTKGRKAEKEVKKILEDRGYKVQLVGGSQVWNKDVDFFEGMFDGFGYNKSEFVFFQVKCNKTDGWLKKARLWLENNQNTPPKNSKIMLFVRLDGCGSKKVEYKEYLV